ncbi:MAG TPA: radical SAM protein [Candidatus Pelethocola excrementipullorum]|nr:radical SAM protein [Candidatus Pelethocola excrementipullorum]
MEYIQAKRIVTRNKKGSSWFGNDYNMNIYKGCSHGCIYCDSRSDCYRIDDFDKVRAKEDALRLIRDDLRGYGKRGVVGTGAMSDPYNPFEKKLMLTRHALELVDAYEYGITIATKSTLLLRDLDVLKGIQEHSPVLCKVTITTADDSLSSVIEPHVASSSERFEMLARLSEAGIPGGILLMPVLPFLEDSVENVLEIVEKAHEAGAKFIYPAFGMTLRQNQRTWYFDKLNQLFPEENYVERYMKAYGNNYNCTSRNAKKLWKVFTEACKQYRILFDMKDIIHYYKRGYEITQMSLFDL